MSQHDTRQRLRPGWSRWCGPLLALAALAAGASLAAMDPDGRPADGGEFCLSGARILDAQAGRYLQVAGVLVQGDRIAAVYRQPAERPSGVRVIDLAGATLVPGFFDLHATATPTSSADADFYYAMALAHGVTSFRVVDAPLTWAARQRARAKSGDLLAPRLWISGPGVDQVGIPGLALRLVPDAGAARREVADQAREGADFIRAHAGTGAAVLRAIVVEARAAKLRTSAEPGSASIVELAGAGVTLVDRLAWIGTGREEAARLLGAAASEAAGDADVLDDLAWSRATDGEIASAAARIALNRSGLVPLLAAHRGILDAAALKADPALEWLPARWREGLGATAYEPSSAPARRAARAAQARGRAAAVLSKAGVRLATGVDVSSRGYNVPGAGIHRELALLVAAGLSPAEAIRCATVNGAEFVGAGATLGQVKPGFHADIFAVDGDPLRNVGDLLRIRLVVRGGEVLDRAELLQQAKRAGRRGD